MAIAGIFKHINSFIQPGFILDMMVKTMVLYVVSVYMSYAVEKLFASLPYFSDDVEQECTTTKNEAKIKPGSIKKLKNIVCTKLETTDELKKWIQVLVQIAVCAPLAFILRAVVEYLGNKYDFLDEVMSPKSAAGAGLIAGMAFFMNQPTLKNRMAALSLGLQ